MPKPLVVVTGKNGQLGWELMQLAEHYSHLFNFLFTDRSQLNLLDENSITDFFKQYQPAYFIHCAAYTAVDKAESEQDIAYKINTAAMAQIARHCKVSNTVLIHISTDYVFDGKGLTPYKIDTPTDPVNYYGYTKRIGEELALQNNPATVIIRTSWLYSSHGHNFVKTMLRLMSERDLVKVVTDQKGCPTYAHDLAEAIMQIVTTAHHNTLHTGIFHYSNTGETNWYEFAKAIRDAAAFTCVVEPITTTDYPTPAKRPGYSVMDLTAIAEQYGIVLHPWKDSLAKCLSLLNS
ncbi:MAG: dTDP-4-dehydrorhamnose reductase [Bacteroidota bacterium]|jgi:dTDP-4-dehydrorhamnose reductase